MSGLFPVLRYSSWEYRPLLSKYVEAFADHDLVLSILFFLILSLSQYKSQQLLWLVQKTRMVIEHKQQNLMMVRESFLYFLCEIFFCGSSFWGKIHRPKIKLQQLYAMIKKEIELILKGLAMIFLVRNTHESCLEARKNTYKSKETAKIPVKVA